jgi:hypothetical protein
VWDEPGFEWWSEEKGGRGPIDEESVRVGYLDGEVGPGVEKRVCGRPIDEESVRVRFLDGDVGQRVEKGWWSTDRRGERARAFS